MQLQIIIFGYFNDWFLAAFFYGDFEIKGIRGFYYHLILKCICNGEMDSYNRIVIIGFVSEVLIPIDVNFVHFSVFKGNFEGILNSESRNRSPFCQ